MDMRGLSGMMGIPFTNTALMVPIDKLFYSGRVMDQASKQAFLSEFVLFTEPCL